MEVTAPPIDRGPRGPTRLPIKEPRSVAAPPTLPLTWLLKAEPRPPTMPLTTPLTRFCN
jgi:hypothetical protein